MGSARSARIADQIQRSLAELIRTEVRDPRVGMVTLTAVELSRDQSHAKVFFTVLGAQAAGADALEGLTRAAGFLRSQLAHELTTRKVPELHFAYDESVERGVRLSQLIDEAVRPAPVAKPKRAPRKPKP
ncbi:MAG TPA: 30S ribosome-binding factor RbfA [Usitatibacter sp.]|jgi:ribosome-binding factor A|nr:30S ribosome-binding factor RbfA [Usitatibacter sp.]